MQHLFYQVAILVFLAAICGVFFSKIKQLPMIGYVVAGVLLGPQGFALIQSEHEISHIAEFGVVLLLFVIGMELPLKTFRKTYKAAILTTLGMITLSLCINFGLGLFIPLSLNEKLIYGFIISLSSTAVAVKLLDSIDLLQKPTGQIAINILIAQDILFVPMIMIVNSLNGSVAFSYLFLLKVLSAILILVGLVVFLSKKEKVHLLFEKSVEKHNDLIPVAALTWALVGAAISEYAGFSAAYGAFLAGLIIGNSYSKEVVLPKIEPMQSVLVMVFFLSIGMLIDFDVIQKTWVLIFALLISAMLFKTMICTLLLKLFMSKETLKNCFIAGLTISQIGEFSFILATAGLTSGVFPSDDYKVIIAVIALSLAFSPLWMTLLNKLVSIISTVKPTKSLV